MLKPMDKAPSFSRLVLGSAVANTSATFGDWKQKTYLGLFSAVSGFGLQWLVSGWDVAVTQIFQTAMFIFGPIGFSVVVIFLWNLWLAPSELAYKSMTVAAPTAHPKAPIEAPVNWVIWKNFDKYTVKEFAAILAKRNPTNLAQTFEQAAYEKLIFEDIGTKMLGHIPRIVKVYGNRDYEKEIDGDTQIKKNEAIVWAEAKHFPIAHIK